MEGERGKGGWQADRQTDRLTETKRVYRSAAFMQPPCTTIPFVYIISWKCVCAFFACLLARLLAFLRDFFTLVFVFCLTRTLSRSSVVSFGAFFVFTSPPVSFSSVVTVNVAPWQHFFCVCEIDVEGVSSQWLLPWDINFCQQEARFPINDSLSTPFLRRMPGNL